MPYNFVLSCQGGYLSHLDLHPAMMPWSSVAKIAGVSAGTLLLALVYPGLSDLSPLLFSFVPYFPLPDYPLAVPFFTSQKASAPFVCDASHTYKTELVSLDPLVIYIHSLISPAEITSLLKTAEPGFAPSLVVKDGHKQAISGRTSSSAGLPRDDPAVVCVLNRARNFMGTMMRDGWDEMGPPQLVQYSAGQHFNLHHDWYETPLWATDGSNRKWNRVASFFAILDGNCTGGETHFRDINGIVAQSPRKEPSWVGGWHNAKGEEDIRPLWRTHEAGGLAFRPVAGNAIFWVNLHPNGTGDMRTMHAGLPVRKGTKTAMNIWPRQFYAYD
jgi:prolyl 4-hydroxylase